MRIKEGHDDRVTQPHGMMIDMAEEPTPASTPILNAKVFTAPSVFQPENLLREARRQKGVPYEIVPDVCVLDPDGDLVRQLRADERVQPCAGWPCYHTDLFTFAHGGERFGIVGCAVGAPFAVLVAEQLFASGCRLLISVTSAGQIVASGPTPYFILIDRAIRDEGTSYHYLPPSQFAAGDEELLAPVMTAMADTPLTVQRGATWTTDAPFRETEAAIEAARAHGALAVEMEAAALYAFAAARGKSVLCFAHVTNQMAQIEGDFEKGAANGAQDALVILCAAACAWRKNAA
jgi:uridine phosphorylase